MVCCWKKLTLESKNDQVDLIRRFGSDRSSHQWYSLKSRKYKKGGATLREIGFGSCAHSTSIFCTVVALTKKVERSYYFYSYHDSNLDFFVYSVVVTKVDD